MALMEISKCPLCGSPAKLDQHPRPSGHATKYYIKCTNKECELTLPDFGTWEGLIKHWNKRT